MQRHRFTIVFLTLTTLFAASLVQKSSASSSSGDTNHLRSAPQVVSQGRMPATIPSGVGTAWKERVFGVRREKRFSSSRTVSKVPQAPVSILKVAAVYDTGGDMAESIVSTDLDGDGRADLVVANQCAAADPECSGSIGVRMGKPDGSFQTAVSYPSGGNRAFSVVVGDVNGDGKPDLMVANACATGGNFCENGTMGVIGVLLGNGNGTFQPALTFSSGGFNAAALATRDVNGDGKPDLLVVNSCGDPNSCRGGLAVLLGNGDGSFQNAVVYDAGNFFSDSLAVGDLDGDGKLDVAVLSRCGDNFCLGEGTVGVLSGNGDGTFKTAISFDVGGRGPLAITIRDLNGDSKLDLLVTIECPNNGSCASSSVGVFLNRGNGNFQPPAFYPSGGVSPTSLVTADLIGDGKFDLLVSNECAIGDPSCTGDGVVGVLLGNGDGTFNGTVSYSSAGLSATSVYAGDVNGDGKLDLLVANNCSNSTSCGGSTGILPGNGDGTFAAAIVFDPGGQDVFSLAAVDVNNDGNPDLLSAFECSTSAGCLEGSGISVSLGNGDGTFQTPGIYSSGGSQARSVAVTDVNGDGNPDLVAANECVSDSNCAGVVGVLLGNGDGSFQAAVSYATGGQNATSVVVADMNRDGHPDLLVANLCADVNCTSSSIGVLLGNGDGTFQAAISYPSGGASVNSISVADVDGDGQPDLLVANECSIIGGCANSGLIGVLKGNADGSLQPVVAYDSGGEFPYSLKVADINGDGKADLLIVNQCIDSVCANGTLGVLLGNGNGTFHVASSTAVPPSSFASLAIADFDGDGKLDVAISNGLLLLGNGNGYFQSPLTLGVSGFGVAVGDFNRDGRPDLALGGIAMLMNISGQGVGTTSTLVSSLNPSTYGQLVTFTARVVQQGAVTPTGTITFKDGDVVLGTSVLTNRHTTLTTSTLAAGYHAITASYSGDSQYQANVSRAVNQMVGPATSVITLSSSGNPVPLNQTVTYTTGVSSQYGGAVTGTVTFKDRAKTIGTASVTGGQASFSIPFSVVGTHLITAAYSGDVSSAGSTSSALSTYVASQPVSSKTVVTTSLSPALVNQAVSFTATVTSGFGAIPDGEAVFFFDGTTLIGTGDTAGGVATFTTSALSAKAHLIKATYAGDDAFRSSTGSVHEVVMSYFVTMAVTSSPSPASYGEPVTLTTRVTSTAPHAPTGTVTFRNENGFLGTSTLNNGIATLATTKLPAGTVAITAIYNGDELSAKSTMATNQTIRKAATGASVTSSVNPSLVGRMIRFTATVSSATTAVTGPVTFMDGTSAIGSGNLAGGQVSFRTATLASGTHRITVVYQGNANIAGSTSSPLVETIN